jgi:hypothetical protein
VIEDAVGRIGDNSVAFDYSLAGRDDHLCSRLFTRPPFLVLPVSLSENLPSFRNRQRPSLDLLAEFRRLFDDPPGVCDILSVAADQFADQSVSLSVVAAVS